MRNIFLSLLLVTSLFGQVNRILNISPTSQESSIGNQSLVFHNPARNLFNKDQFNFSRVNWMSNIVNDMGYNYVGMDRSNFGIDILFFNYGVQNQTDEYGIILGQFTPLSAIYNFSYARQVNKYNLGIDTKIITHNLHTQDALGVLLGVGLFLPDVYKELDVDVMIQNFGMVPKFGSWKSELPTSLNIAFSYLYKNFMFYNQDNFYKGYYTFGSGMSYNYNNMLWGRIGYSVDNTHKLNYPTFGIDFKYDKYLIGISYIYGSKELPLGNTIKLTINLEL
ncbi:MAG: hypothetical protein H8E03_01245 [Pelagibacteraceae bacterium]|nr:hypothetical protein [Pelagibacteraceae bacterium]